MYLELSKSGAYRPNCNTEVLNTNRFVYYQLPAAGRELIQQWWRTPADKDQIVSGVLADWLEDHREVLIESSTSPDPTPLNSVIDNLRRRYTHSIW